MTRSSSWAVAINTAGSPTRRRSAAPSWRSSGFKGTEGEYNFDENGDGLHGYNVVKNDNGKIVFDRRIDFQRLSGRLDASSFQLLFTGLGIGSIYALVSLGFVLLIRAASVVNFAQGEFSMLGAYFMVILANDLGVPYFLAIPIAVVLMAGFGVLFAGAVYWPLRHRGQLPVIISTIGASIFLANTVLATYGPSPQVLPGLFDNPGFDVGGVFMDSQYLAIIVITALLVLLQYLVFEKTLLGKKLQATSQDKEMASLLGIPVALMVLFTFAYSAALGGHRRGPGGAGAVRQRRHGGGGGAEGVRGQHHRRLRQHPRRHHRRPGAGRRGDDGGGYISRCPTRTPSPSRCCCWSCWCGRRGCSANASRRRRDERACDCPGPAVGAAWLPALGRPAWCWHAAAQMAPAVRLHAEHHDAGGDLRDRGRRAGGGARLLRADLAGAGGVLRARRVWRGAGRARITCCRSSLALLARRRGRRVFGLVLGFASLRLGGHYLAMVTISFQQILTLVLTNWIGLTHGPDGVSAIAAPGRADVRGRRYLSLCLVTLVGTTLYAWRLKTSRLGRAMQAVRDNEIAAGTCGIDIVAHQGAGVRHQRGAGRAGRRAVRGGVRLYQPGPVLLRRVDRAADHGAAGRGAVAVRGAARHGAAGDAAGVAAVPAAQVYLAVYGAAR